MLFKSELHSLLTVYWHNILINRVRMILRHFVQDPSKEINTGYWTYRLIDRILTVLLFPLMYRITAGFWPNWVPKFARKTAMGIELVFR